VTASCERGLPGAAGCRGRTGVSELGGARKKDPVSLAGEEKGDGQAVGVTW
jgi:hypothetical protein